jgi:hypothetical protein
MQIFRQFLPQAFIALALMAGHDRVLEEPFLRLSWEIGPRMYNCGAERA